MVKGPIKSSATITVVSTGRIPIAMRLEIAMNSRDLIHKLRRRVVVLVSELNAMCSIDKEEYLLIGVQ